MKLNPEIFREYDIRGIVGKDIDASVFTLIGKAFGTYLQKDSLKRVVVGSDNRLSSPELTEAFITGLLSTGCSASDAGTATSPMLYFASCNYDFDASACITASHNPKDYNGIKFTYANAKPIFGSMLQELRKIIESKKFAEGKGKLSKKEILGDYIKMLKSKVNIEDASNAVIDCGNGTAGLVAKHIFPNAEILFEEPDGTFPNHLPDPTKPEYLTEVIARCKKEKKFGIAFDGDADRIGVVSEQGEVIWGDQLMVIFARDILKKHPNAKILFEVKCSQALYDEILSNKGIPIVWKTGHSLIKSKMKKENALLAGEMSGHMFFADEYYGYDDAVYAALRLLEIVRRTGKNINQLLEGLPKYTSTPEYRIDCPDNRKFQIVEQTKEHFSRKYPDSITVDGIRIVYPDGWALVRASNTQPKLILRFEAKNPATLQTIKSELLQHLKQYPELSLDI